jgi:hypothetical protein
MKVQGSREMTVGMSFAQTVEGVQVTATFRKVAAYMTQPMGEPQTATEADIGGNLVFTIDQKGNTTDVTLPETMGAAEQLVRLREMAYGFFPALPGGTVDPGDTWTDTLSLEVPVGEGSSSTESITTYTLVGDTVVDGAALLLITHEGKTETVQHLVNSGIEMVQSLSGDSEGQFLWDPARSLLVVGESTVELDGTTEVPAMGMPPMPISVKGTSNSRLVGG